MNMNMIDVALGDDGDSGKRGVCAPRAPLLRIGLWA